VPWIGSKAFRPFTDVSLWRSFSEVYLEGILVALVGSLTADFDFSHRLADGMAKYLGIDFITVE
jgi:hypothetical protein